MSKRHYVVHTDGSATTHGTRTGAWAAIITCGDQTRTVCGACAPTTIGRMEVTAINAALDVIVSNEPDSTTYSVEIWTDSQYCSLAAQGVYKREKNRPQWAMFDALAAGMDLSIGWAPRNTLLQQGACDELAGRLRRLLESALPHPDQPQPEVSTE